MLCKELNFNFGEKKNKKIILDMSNFSIQVELLERDSTVYVGYIVLTVIQFFFCEDGSAMSSYYCTNG